MCSLVNIAEYPEQWICFTIRHPFLGTVRVISLGSFDSYRGCRSPAQHAVLVLRETGCLRSILGASKVFTSECNRVRVTASVGKYPQFSTTWNYMALEDKYHNFHNYIIKKNTALSYSREVRLLIINNLKYFNVLA